MPMEGGVVVPVRCADDLGAVIRAERRRQGMTQVELAGLADVGVTFLSQLENGKESAEVGRALRVLTMLGVDLFAEARA